MKIRLRHIPVALAVVSALNLQPLPVFAQGTAFTYQGRLNDGGFPATGTYDLRVILYDADIGGSQQGPILTTNGVPVRDGLFTVTLDFGAAFSGGGRWLDIAVRTNGASSFVPLTPRQPVTPAPYAITAGQVISGGLATGTYSSAVTFDNPANSFSGSGAGLTSISASSLNSGTISDARLSPNVALLNRSQTFTQTNVFISSGIGTNIPGAAVEGINGSESSLSDPFGPGLWGDSLEGDGVFGSSGAVNGYGVYGSANAVGGIGVYGDDSIGSGESDQATPSVWGDSATGDGVFGSTSSEYGYGVYGLSSGTNGVGVYGAGTASGSVGVLAQGADSSSIALSIDTGGIQVTGAGPGTSTPAFIHVAASGNISGDATIINNPLCNGDPNAILIITPNSSAGSGPWNHPVGVVYNGSSSRWRIFNEDSANMTVGPAFNVLVINP